MLAFVALLIAATFASGAWCAGEALPRRAQAGWLTGRRGASSAALLAAVVVVATGLRFLLVPAHYAMYIDEPWYAEAACNLARLGRLVVCEETWSGRVCESYAKGWGWPVFLSPWTLVVGCDTAIGIQINRVLGSATVALVAFAVRCAGGGWRQSIIAASMLAIHPIHVAWSATAETNVPEAAALLAGLCGALLYVRAGRLSGAALAVSGLGLSTAIRPESCVAAVVAAVILALMAPARLKQRLLVASAIGIVCATAAATGLQLWAMNEEISSGPFLTLGNIPRSLLLLTRGDSFVIHGVVALAAVAGAAALARARQLSAAGLLLSTAIAGAVVVLTYERFHERMLLGATVGLLPLGGFILDWPLPFTMGRRTRAIISAVAFGTVALAPLLLWQRALLSVALPPETQLLETRIASRVAQLQLPGEALFITEQPPVLAATGIAHVMATRQALGDEAQLRGLINTGRPIYFLCDMYCEAGFQGVTPAPVCRQMLEQFALSPVAEETLNSRRYVLYRVSGPASGGATPECPGRIDS